jgi:hypothetical protein
MLPEPENRNRVGGLCTGTVIYKGDSIPERPHRLSQMFKAPEPIETVSKQLLEALAAEAPAGRADKPEKKKTPSSLSVKTSGGWTPELVESTLDKAELNHSKAQEYNGVDRWQHDCLNNPDHHKINVPQSGATVSEFVEQTYFPSAEKRLAPSTVSVTARVGILILGPASGRCEYGM